MQLTSITNYSLRSFIRQTAQPYTVRIISFEAGRTMAIPRQAARGMITAVVFKACDRFSFYQT